MASGLELLEQTKAELYFTINQKDLYLMDQKSPV